MPNLKPFGLALLFAIFPVAASRAHDFWIEPSTFTPAPGQRVAVRLRVGQELRGDPVPRELDLLQRFVMVGPKGESPVPGLPNTDPAGFAAFQSPGLYTVIYDSGRHPLELDAAKFEAYLSQE